MVDFTILLISKLIEPSSTEKPSYPFTGLISANRKDLIQVLDDLHVDQIYDPILFCSAIYFFNPLLNLILKLIK